MPTLVVENLSKTYVADVGEVTVLQGVSLTMHGGESAAVVGPSGIGKLSVVKAGLIPALRSGAAPGSEHWLFPTCSPARIRSRSLARRS